MKYVLTLIFCLTLSSLSFSQENNDESTTYVLIRHAEKDNDGTRNPHLSEEGVIRAAGWSEILKAFEFDAIYSTDYFRTKETAKPIADSKALEVLIYDPRAFDIEAFKTKTRGKKVLIVGHSNTTPANTNKLMGSEKYENLDESIYGNLYIITIQDGKASDMLLSLK